MEHILLVIHVIIAAALIGVVLIQRSDTDGFGLGGGTGGSFMTGRATANLLTRTTAILATLFIVNSLALSWLASNSREGSIVDTISQEQGEPNVPLAIEKNDENDAIAPAMNRNEVMDTDKAARKASAKKAAKEPIATEADAPAVPTAD